MIFMSETGLVDATREADYDVWYDEHLRIMASVAGVTTAQRFKTSTPGCPPSLAMYTVVSADVFKDPYYLSVRGLGEWDRLVDRRHYHRNLFTGLDLAPAVPPNACLLVADRSAPDADRVPFVWLEAVGLDKSTPYRGIAVVPARETADIPPDRRVAVYRPVAAQLTGRSKA